MRWIVAFQEGAAIRPGQERAARFAIRPYPVDLETEFRHNEEKLRIRPIRPQDEALLDGFVRRLSREDVRMRFFGPLRELSHEMAARLTQIDYDREMTFVAMVPQAGGEPVMVGEARAVCDPDNLQAEFAIQVATDWQGRGLGRQLALAAIKPIDQRYYAIKASTATAMMPSRTATLMRHLAICKSSGW